MSANDVARAMEIASSALQARSKTEQSTLAAGASSTVLPGLPQPLGCDECERQGRHTSHTLRTIDSAGQQATAVMQRAVEDACRTRQVQSDSHL